MQSNCPLSTVLYLQFCNIFNLQGRIYVNITSLINVLLSDPEVDVEITFKSKLDSSLLDGSTPLKCQQNANIKALGSYKGQELIIQEFGTQRVTGIGRKQHNT